MSNGLAQGDGDIALAGGYPNIFPTAANNSSFYPSPFFIDTNPEGDFGAQETLARLYDAEYQDYLQRFFPVEQRLMFEMQEGFAEQQQQEIERAQMTAARTFANLRGQEQRRRAGFGMNIGGTTNTALDRAETSSIVAARNFARMRAEERRLQILSGGLGSIAQDRSTV
tara:strand:- start:355 stop:861 length:507 start_codon:yes stop_codon:yes gene_type:complete